MDSILTIAEFRQCYPGLSACATDQQIQCAFEEVDALYNCFASFPPKQQKLAVKYATAHSLYFAVTPTAIGGQIKSIKNKQDRIEYVGATEGIKGSFSLYSTVYGANLARLMRYSYTGGFVSGCRSRR